MQFNTIKKAISKQLNTLNNNELFIVEVDRDKIFEVYIGAFPNEEEQQIHTCNCCKSFLRQYGGIVWINAKNELVSLWDNVTGEFEAVAQALSKYVKSLPIAGLYLNTEKACGTNQNYDTKRKVTWTHFYVELPQHCVTSRNPNDLISVRLGSFETFQRALREIKPKAIEDVLELIADNSLYRGQTYKKTLESFQACQTKFVKLKGNKAVNFCWKNSKDSVVAGIRNSAIGTFLINLSDGMDIEQAVKKFEAVTAPSNYKRPKAIVTTAMVDKARKTLEEAGLLDSLQRRFATPNDVPVQETLFVDRSSEFKDVWTEMGAEAPVDTKKSLRNAKNISINEFLRDVVPQCKTVEALVENTHLNRMATLLTSQKEDVAPLFKWSNNLSWAYTGDVTDSIKERVKKAGGKVDAFLCCRLSWGDPDDLDLHAKEPQGTHIYFGQKTSRRTFGQLDVDMNASRISTSPVENIFWPQQSKMQKGKYTLYVHNYQKRPSEHSGFEVEIESKNGDLWHFQSSTSPQQNSKVHVCDLHWDGKTFRMESKMKQSNVSREKWHVKTNTFTKVKTILNSPNCWNGNPVGHRHTFFILDGCKADEKMRPFFGEYLQDNLTRDYKRVFELMGSKLKVDPTEQQQLSGVGFSESQKGSSIVVRATTDQGKKLFRVTF